MDTILLPTGTNPDLQWAVTAYKTHGGNYGQYRDYIEGREDVRAVMNELRSAYGREARKYVYNRCAAVVDAHADRMQIEGFGADNEAISQAAQDLWDANQMDIREGMVEQDAFGLGDGYAIVEVDPDNGDVLVWPQYAENIRVKYSDTRPGRITQAARRWHDPDIKRLRLNLYYPDRIEKYVSAREFTELSGVDWNTKDWVRHEAEGEPWPVYLNVKDTVPVFHFANNARVNAYGTSELRDVIPIQDNINESLNLLNVGMRFYAWPQMWVIGVGIDEDSGTALQRVQAGIDRMLVLTGDGENRASVGQFAPASMSPYLEVIDADDHRISRVSKVPARYLNQESQAISGTSKRMDESPFVSKIEDRQRAFGYVWSEVIRYGLRLMGMAVEPGAIRVNWKSAAPLAEDEVWTVAQQKIDAGMPFEAALREAGYEPDQIATILAERAADREATLVADFGGGEP